MSAEIQLEVQEICGAGIIQTLQVKITEMDKETTTGCFMSAKLLVLHFKHYKYFLYRQ